MPYQFPPDIDQLAKEQMASGLYASEDEMLRAATAAGIDDYEARRHRPLNER